MSPVTLHVWSNGDPSVGIDGHQATVIMPVACAPENEAEFLKEAKELLRLAFEAMWCEKTYIATSAELDAPDPEDE